MSFGADWVPEDKIGRIIELRDRGVRTILCSYDLIPYLFPHLSYEQTVARFPAFLRRLGAAAESSCAFRIAREETSRHTSHLLRFAGQG